MDWWLGTERGRDLLLGTGGRGDFVAWDWSQKKGLVARDLRRERGLVATGLLSRTGC